MLDDKILAALGDKAAAERLTERGELTLCPFCHNEAVVHIVESQSRYAEYKKEIPKEARFIRCVCYPSGKRYFEYRLKEYVPQCVDSSCCGRTVKRYKTMAEAIKTWNTRAPILTPEQIKRLEEM